MSEPRFIRIEFGEGVPQDKYDKFSEDVMDLAEARMAEMPEDCDNEIWVSGGGEVATKPKPPRQPEMGSFCEHCGHFAARHNEDGCNWLGGCYCQAMKWDGRKWPRPWLPAPEGLRHG